MTRLIQGVQLALEWYDVLANPRGQLMLREFAPRRRDHDVDRLQLRHLELESVDQQECVRRQERDALVAIHESMNLRQAECVCRGQNWKADITPCVGPPVLRSGQGGFDQAFIADAQGAAMLLNEVSMHGLECGAVEPDGLPHRLQGQLSKRVTVLLGATTVRGHRLVKDWIEWRQKNTPIRLNDEDLVANTEVKAVSEVLGKRRADRAGCRAFSAAHSVC